MEEKDLMDQVEDAQKEFRENPEVIELRKRLREIHTEICDKHVDFDSEDFEEENEGYNSSNKEDDTDEMSLFDFMWFNSFK